jgi:hypothetical protein
MNDQAIKHAYELFVENGYTKSKDEFKVLIKNNSGARKSAFDLFVENGYTKGEDDFSTLMGVTDPPVKKKEPTAQEKMSEAMAPKQGGLDFVSEDSSLDLSTQQGRDEAYKESQDFELQKDEELRTKLAEQTYTYAGRPGAKYKKQPDGSYLINLGDKTQNKYIPLDDPDGTRTAELNRNAISDITRFKKSEGPYGSWTKILSGQEIEDVELQADKEKKAVISYLDKIKEDQFEGAEEDRIYFDETLIDRLEKKEDLLTKDELARESFIKSDEIKNKLIKDKESKPITDINLSKRYDRVIAGLDTDTEEYKENQRIRSNVKKLNEFNDIKFKKDQSETEYVTQLSNFLKSLSGPESDIFTIEESSAGTDEVKITNKLTGESKRIDLDAGDKYSRFREKELASTFVEYGIKSYKEDKAVKDYYDAVKFGLLSDDITAFTEERVVGGSPQSSVLEFMYGSPDGGFEEKEKQLTKEAISNIPLDYNFDGLTPEAKEGIIEAREKMLSVIGEKDKIVKYDPRLLPAYNTKENIYLKNKQIVNKRKTINQLNEEANNIVGQINEVDASIALGRQPQGLQFETFLGPMSNLDKRNYLVKQLNTKVNALDEEQQSLQDIEVNLNQSAAVNFAIQEKRGSTLGAMAKSFLSGGAGFAGFVMGDTEKDIYGQTYEQRATEDLVPGIITDEYIASKDRGDLFKVTTGVLPTFGSMLTGSIILPGVGTVASKITQEGFKKTGAALRGLPSSAGIYGMLYSENKNLMSSPEFDDIPEWEKKTMSALYAGVSTLLEKFGLSRALSKTPLGKNLTAKIINKTFSEIPKGASAKVISNRIKQNARVTLNERLLSGSVAGLAESGTEFTQAVYDIGLKNAYNAIKEKDYFEVASTYNAISDVVWENWKLGLYGGFMMNTAGQATRAVAEGFNEKTRLNDVDFKVMYDFATKGNMYSTYEAQLNTQVALGKMTEKDAQAKLDGIGYAKGIFDQIPDNLNTSDAKEAFNLIVEKRNLESKVEGKEPNLVVKEKERIKEIDNELTELGKKEVVAEEVAEPTVAEEVVGEVVVAEDTYAELDEESKSELKAKAIDAMKAETGETEFTPESIDERAAKIFEQEVSELDSELGDDVRFRVEEEGESLVESEESDVDAIVEEMNAMPKAQLSFKVPEGGSTVEVNPIEESNSTEEFTEEDAKEMGFESKSEMVKAIEEFDDIPMGTVVSDVAAGGKVKDSRGNDMSAKGGIMFNAIAKVKAAWAGVKKSVSETQVKNALEIYEGNKELFDRLWKEGKLPDGHIPMAVIRMANSAIHSNEILFRYLSPEIKAQPMKNQQAALNVLVNELNNKKGEQNKAILNFISKNKIKNLGELYDAIVKDAKKRAKGDIKNTLTLDERKVLAETISIKEGKKDTIPRTKDGKVSNKILNALYEGVDDTTADVFMFKNIYKAIGEPSMMKTNKGDVVSIVGIDVKNPGVIDIDHGNYGTGPRGRLIALISNPQNGIDLFPEWAAKSNRIFKESKSGRTPSEKVVKGQTMGTVPSDKAFQGAAPTSKITDLKILIGKLKFAFPGVTVVTTKQEFDEMLKQPGVRTKITKGKTILGITADGRIFLNPESSSLATPIHEFAHIWVDFLRSKASGQEGTDLFKKGTELVEGTDALNKAIEKYGDNALAREEALVELIASKGETIINASKKSDFIEWLNGVFKYIKEKFVSSEKLFAKEEIKKVNKLKDDKKITSKEADRRIRKIKKSVREGIQSMSLEDFINTGLADLFQGKEVSKKFDAAKESRGAMPRFELGDDVVKFIKDARGQGKSEAAIKTILKKRGVDAEVISDSFAKSKGEAEVESKVSEEFAKGFDRVMKEIDGVIEKIKARNAKADTNPNTILKGALEYLKGTKLYEQSTDVQREKMVRDLRSKLGIKEKKSPTPKAAIKKAEKELGLKLDNPSKITLTQKQAIAAQIKALNRGAKDAVKAFRLASKMLSEQMDELVKSGKITTKQSVAIIKKFSNVNMLKDSSIDGFVDYMSRVFKDAEYAEKVKNANKKRKNALKNIKRKIGVAASVKSQLNRIFSINANIIPESAFNKYIELLNDFGSREKVITPSDNRIVEKKANEVLELIDQELSSVPELRQKLFDFDDKVINEKTGGIDYAKTVDKMFSEGIISESDKEIMKKYKSEILPKKEKVKKTEQEIEQERQDVISSIEDTKISTSEINMLPSKNERNLARRFRDLIENREALESLSLNDLKQIEKLIDNIENGYLPHLVFTMSNKMSGNIDGQVLESSIRKAKILSVEKIYSGLKTLIRGSKENDVIRRGLNYYIDNTLGDFKTKNVFNSLFKNTAQAVENFQSAFKQATDPVNIAREKVYKSFKKDGDKFAMSSFKQMVYLIQLEYNTNIGNPETAVQASEFLKKTIRNIPSLKDFNYGDKDGDALEYILNEYTDKETGEIDADKLYESFNSAERASIKAIQEQNSKLGETAYYTAAVIRGESITPRNNYVHLKVISTDKGKNSDELQKFSDSLKPSTKAKSLIERKGKASIIDFDVYSSFEKGAKGVLIDYHLTGPVKQAKTALDKAKKDLIGDDLRPDKKNLELYGALEKAYEKVLNSILVNSYTESSIANDVYNFIRKQGYRNILARPSRAAKEFISNLAAVLPESQAFTNGLKVGTLDNRGRKFFLSDSAPKIMSVLGSLQQSRLYPTDKTSSKFIDRGFQSPKGKGVRMKESNASRLVNKYWNKTVNPAYNTVGAISDKILSTPDLIIMKPLWFGKFSSEFKELTGIEPDFDMIEQENEAYLEKYSDALDKATASADRVTIRQGATSNPFLGTQRSIKEKDQSGFVQFAKDFNMFMQNFLNYEFTAAREALYFAMGRGDLSRSKGVAIMASLSARMLLYSVIGDVMSSVLSSLGFTDDDEDDRNLAQIVGQGVGETFVSLVLNRNFGNITKSISNYLIDDVNEEYFDFLREGEFDAFKHSFGYSVIPRETSYGKNPMWETTKNLVGPLGPAVKTLDFAMKKLFEEDAKKPETQDRRFREKFIRLPLEAAGALGFVPFYGDVRKYVLDEVVYSDLRDGKSSSPKAKKKKKSVRKPRKPRSPRSPRKPRSPRR